MKLCTKPWVERKSWASTWRALAHLQALEARMSADPGVQARSGPKG